MNKWRIKIPMIVLILFQLNVVQAQKIKLLKTTRLPHYPSASALEFYNNHLYVTGDDAPQMLVLDKDHRVMDSVPLFDTKEKRIDKDAKADLEACVLVPYKNKMYLALFSSFSTPKRNKVITVDVTNPKGKNNRKVFTPNLGNINLEELNFEGATLVKDQLVLSNRANTTNRNNHFIVSKLDLDNGKVAKEHQIIKVTLPRTKMIAGISGLAYVKEKDMLLFTASSENTPNAYTDGTIGDSYLGYISNVSQKLHQKEIKPDKQINLTPYFKKGQAQKIESIAVEKSSGTGMIIHLAADNDNGESVLFKMKVKL